MINFASVMRIPSNKIKDITQFFREELKGIYSPEEIEIFISYCFEDLVSIKRVDLLSKENETISESELLKFNFAVKDLKKERPVQYILGNAHFYGLNFIVNEHVLIPRPETEELANLIIRENSESNIHNLSFSILDVGTGSGCIPIVLKKHFPGAEISALDISSEALETAKQNAVKHNVKINFIQDDILSPTAFLKDSTFDIIVSNPPYIRFSEKEEMKNNVIRYEPHIALFVNDEDPLLFYDAIADFGKTHLKKEGVLYFEINEHLGEETKVRIEKKGFKNVTLIKDLNNKNRILRCTLNE